MGGVDWIDLAQDTDVWWCLVNIMVTLVFPKNVENFLTI